MTVPAAAPAPAATPAAAPATPAATPAPAAAEPAAPAAPAAAPAAPAAAAPAVEAPPSVMDAVAEGAKPEGDKGKPGKSAGEGELKITYPEGVEVDQKRAEAFIKLATESGLTGEHSEALSKLAGMQLAHEQAAVQASHDEWEKQGVDWAAELKADKDFGGEKMDATTQEATKAMVKFGPPGLAEELASMGLGNHPGLVKLMAKVGRAIGEDSSAFGQAPGDALSDEQKSLREQYPTMYNKDGTLKK